MRIICGRKWWGCLLLLIASPGQARDRSAADEKAAVLVARMTLPEKIALLGGDRSFYLRGVPRLGIPPVKMADGPMGVKGHGRAVAFPASICMAATFNPALIRQIGTAIGRECRAREIGILLAPGVNICRVPQNGRNFEYFGEDPWLASRMAVAFIQGVQSQRVMATVKHFAANNLEYDRHRTDSQMDERTLHEIYLPAFRAAVREGRCGAVMTAYNLLNGFHCSENRHLIMDILKGDWGFAGFVMSDWISVYSPGAITAGLDLEMPRAEFMTEANIRAALDQKIITAADLDDKVRRLLRSCLELRLWDNRVLPMSTRDWQDHERLARQTAQEGIVLLKNEGGLMPLDRQKIRRIALLGPRAEPTPTSGGGAARVEPYREDSIRSGLERYLGGAGRLAWFPGRFPAGLDAQAAEVVAGCDAAIVCAGFDERIEGEGHDRPFALPPDQVELIQAVRAANPRTIVVITAGGGVEMEPWLAGVSGVIQNWYLGQVSGEALASIVFGTVNPSGKLPVSVEKRREDAAAYGAYDVAKSEQGLPPLFTLHGKPHEIIPVPYQEGLFTGYRHFDARGIEPLFPFGFGLSYTTFECQELKVTRLHEFDYRIEATICNTGRRSGQEVVQVYVSDMQCRVPRPPKELKAFAKVLLRPGERKRVAMTLNRESFAFYNAGMHCREVVPGGFLIQAGNSSRHIWRQEMITIEKSCLFKP